MEFLIFAAVLFIGVVLVIPLAAMELKKTGTVRQPRMATFVGGALGGFAMEIFTPVRKMIWETLLYSELGLSPLSSRALTAAIIYGATMVVALYLEALVRRVRHGQGG